jgi:hypothetical protein
MYFKEIRSVAILHPGLPGVLRRFETALLYPRPNPRDIISGQLLPIQAYLGYMTHCNSSCDISPWQNPFLFCLSLQLVTTVHDASC